MPHVVIKIYAGRSEEQKTRLAEAIAKSVIETLHCGENSVSVEIADVPAAEWTEKVYKPEILPNWDKLYKKPGYEPS